MREERERSFRLASFEKQRNLASASTTQVKTDSTESKKAMAGIDDLVKALTGALSSLNMNNYIHVEPF